jgi:hypothetical protein
MGPAVRYVLPHVAIVKPTVFPEGQLNLVNVCGIGNFEADGLLHYNKQSFLIVLEYNFYCPISIINLIFSIRRVKGP